MRVVPHAKNASQAAKCERKRNPVIHGSVRCADGDGRLSTTKTYHSPRLVTRSHFAGHPTETHHAASAGPISSGNLFEKSGREIHRRGRGGSQRKMQTNPTRERGIFVGAPSLARRVGVAVKPGPSVIALRAQKKGPLMRQLRLALLDG